MLLSIFSVDITGEMSTQLFDLQTVWIQWNILVILFIEEHLHKLCLFCLANGSLQRESRLKENVRGTEVLSLAPAHFVRSFVMTTNSTLTKVSLCQSRLLAKSSNVFFSFVILWLFLTWNDFKNKSRKDRSSSPSVKNRSVCFVKLKTVFDNNELQLLI